MPGWKSDLGRRLDALIVRAAPNVRKAVKWNSPFYGVEGQGWFLSFHCYTNYVKVAFFTGALLSPPPPGASKQQDVRYLDIGEGAFDEAQFADRPRRMISNPDLICAGPSPWARPAGAPPSAPKPGSPRPPRPGRNASRPSAPILPAQG
jgi:hypothetical protein